MAKLTTVKQSLDNRPLSGKIVLLRPVCLLDVKLPSEQSQCECQDVPHRMRAHAMTPSIRCDDVPAWYIASGLLVMPTLELLYRCRDVAYRAPWSRDLTVSGYRWRE